MVAVNAFGHILTAEILRLMPARKVNDSVFESAYSAFCGCCGENHRRVIHFADSDLTGRV